MSQLLLGTYQNGNYTVKIYEDGTKIRETINPDDTEFQSDFPENIDLKISDRCNRGCYWCHEDSTPKGKIANLDPLPEFFDTLKPYTELAIGGGNVFETDGKAKGLLNFLKKLQEKKILANITVNQKHFMEHRHSIAKWAGDGLVHGIGISLEEPNKHFIDQVKCFPNAVIHVINGIVTEEQLLQLSYRGLKLLILGYKKWRRGDNYYKGVNSSGYWMGGLIEHNKQHLKDNLEEVLKKFKVVSFDNLALEQLDVKSMLSREKWDEIYMGDDGQFTMYIDLVNERFAKNSTSSLGWDLWDDIKDMFQHVKKHGSDKKQYKID